jgi:hypothetical protein
MLSIVARSACVYKILNAATPHIALLTYNKRQAFKMRSGLSLEYSSNVRSVPRVDASADDGVVDSKDAEVLSVLPIADDARAVELNVAAFASKGRSQIGAMHGGILSDTARWPNRRPTNAIMIQLDATVQSVLHK